MKLIKDELFKLRHKKSFKIIIIISIIFSLLINFYYYSEQVDSSLTNIENKIVNEEYALKTNNLTKDEQDETLANLTIDKYMLKQNRDLNAPSLNKMVRLFYDNFWLFILVIAIMYGASALGDEFSENTLKNILLKPFKKTKILKSKYLANILMIIFFIIFLIFFNLLVGLVLFKDNSLSLPIVLYNYQTKSIMELSIFKFLFLKSLTMLPQLILIYSLTFLFSIFLKNTGTTSIVMYIFIIISELINNFIARYDSKIFRLVLTVNWDFGYVLNKQPTMYKFFSLPSAILVCLVYYFIIILASNYFFQKIELKN